MARYLKYETVTKEITYDYGRIIAINNDNTVDVNIGNGKDFYGNSIGMSRVRIVGNYVPKINDYVCVIWEHGIPVIQGSKIITSNDINDFSTSIISEKDIADKIINKDHIADSSPPSGNVIISTISNPNGTIDISWSGYEDDTGVQGYNIYRSNNVDGSGNILLANIGTTNMNKHTDTNTVHNTTYYYWVTAYDFFGNESSLPSSGWESVTAIKTIKPSAPASIYAIARSGRIDISWEKSDSIDVVAYKIEKSTNNGSSYTLLHIVQSNFYTEYNINAPKEDILNWKYRVKSIDIDGLESDSWTVSQTINLTKYIPFDVEIPNPPNKPNVSSTYDGSILITWTHSSPPVDLEKYRIYRSEDGINYYNIAEIEKGTLKYLDTGLKNGQSYTYKISSIDYTGIEGEKSQASDSLQASDLIAPTPPNPAAVGELGAIRLTWNEVEEKGIVYEIWKCSGNTWNEGSANKIASVVGNIGGSNTFVDYSPPTNVETTYTYKLKAVDSWGNISNFSSSSATATSIINFDGQISGMDSSEITDFITVTYPSDMTNLQSLVDGKIEAWFYDHEPGLDNLPAVEWDTEELQNNHLGDLFYNTATGYVYRFALINSVYQWSRIIDQDITTALENASNAQYTADSKRRIFITTPLPPYDIGDLWRITNITGVDFKICVNSRETGSYVSNDWTVVDKGKEYIDQQITEVNTSLISLQELIDDFSDDLKLTLSEANSLEVSLIQLKKESLDLINVATSLNITTEKNNYNNALLSLETELNNWINQANYPLDITLSQRSNIISKLEDVQDKKSILINKIISVKNDNTIDYIDQQITQLDNSLGQLEININDNFSDSKLTIIEANILKTSLQQVINESQDLINIANGLNITTEKTNYNTALTDLQNHLNTNWLDKSDYPLTITTNQRDIIRTKFNTVQNTKSILINKITSVREENALSYADDILGDFIEEVYNEAVSSLQSQLDGKIETWFYDHEPALNNLPAINWTTAELKDKHLSDLFYNTTTGYAYRFALDDSTYKWIKIVDQDVTKALEDASNAQNTADRKRTIFVDTPTIPYYVGDLWKINNIDGIDFKICTATRETGNYNANDWTEVNKTKTYIDSQRSELDASINNLNTVITNAFSDDYITNIEAQNLKLSRDNLLKEATDVRNIAISLSITVTDLDSAISVLNTETDKYIDKTSYPITVTSTDRTNLINSFTDLQSAVTQLYKDIEEKRIVDVDDTLTEYIDGINNSLTEMIDGKVETWFYEHSPTLSNLPASEWTNNETKNKHLGDLFFNTILGYVYRFTLSGSTYQWLRIIDNDITRALTNASKAQDTADRKRATFVTIPIPPYDVGDLWVTSLAEAQGDIKKCIRSRLSGESFSSTDWVLATSYATTTKNFNDRNDRIATIPATPIIPNDGTAIDHTINSDGSCDISFEWAFNGSGNAYDIDGFIVYIRATSELVVDNSTINDSFIIDDTRLLDDEYLLDDTKNILMDYIFGATNTTYAFGVYPSEEQVYYVSADKRAFILYGVSAVKYYTFGVRAYRYVDTDINPTNILVSPIAQSLVAGENPYQPATQIAFSGNILGTINGVPVERIADITPPSGGTIDTVANADGSITITWSDFIDDESDIGGYNIWRATNSSGSNKIIIGTTSSKDNTSFTDNNTVHGTTYYYWVTCFDRAGNESTTPISGWKSRASNNTLTPDAPTSLSAVARAGRIDISWNKSDNTDVIAYRIEKSVNSGSNYSALHTVQTNFHTEYNINVTKETIANWRYRIKAINIVGLESSWVTSGAPNTNIYTPADDLAPTTPTNVSGSSSYDGSITITWTHASPPADLEKYRIYRSEDETNYYNIAEIGKGTLRYTDAGLKNGQTYCYKVSAVDYSGMESALSSASNDLVATDQVAPNPPSLSAYGSLGAIRLTWTEVAEKGVLYEIWRSKNGTWTDQAKIASVAGSTSGAGGTNSYTDYEPSVDTEVTWYYKIRAIDNWGNIGEFSSAVSATSSISVNGYPIGTAITNFNNRNDRINTTPANPVVSNDGTAIDHTVNDDSTADISFEWTFNGSGNAYNIDGFIVYIRSSLSSSVYSFGTNPSEEQIYYLTSEKRSFILYGVSANRYYTFGIQAYRNVDNDINSNGILKSNIVKSTYSSENPYRPSATVAYAGDIIGTIKDKYGDTIAGQEGLMLENIIGYGIESGALIYCTNHTTTFPAHSRFINYSSGTMTLESAADFPVSGTAHYTFTDDVGTDIGTFTYTSKDATHLYGCSQPYYINFIKPNGHIYLWPTVTADITVSSGTVFNHSKIKMKPAQRIWANSDVKANVGDFDGWEYRYIYVDTNGVYQMSTSGTFGGFAAFPPNPPSGCIKVGYLIVGYGLEMPDGHVYVQNKEYDEYGLPVFKAIIKHDIRYREERLIREVGNSLATNIVEYGTDIESLNIGPKNYVTRYITLGSSKKMCDLSITNNTSISDADNLTQGAKFSVGRRPAGGSLYGLKIVWGIYVDSSGRAYHVDQKRNNGSFNYIVPPNVLNVSYTYIYDMDLMPHPDDPSKIALKIVYYNSGSTSETVNLRINWAAW